MKPDEVLEGAYEQNARSGGERLVSASRWTSKVAIMDIPSSIESFWTEFRSQQGADLSDRFYEAFHFDDNAESADELAALVLSGRKRATAGLVWAFESAGKPWAKPGDLSVVTRFSGEPVCVIETRRVTIVPFSEVTAGFAATEGEGDGSLEFWRRAHTAYFGRECQRLGRAFSQDMPVVCEEFAVVFSGPVRTATESKDT